MAALNISCDMTSAMKMLYRRINKVTAQQHFLIPHLEDLLLKVSKVAVQSKLDLAKGYYQMPICAESRDLTGFVMIFQKIMTNVLKDCLEFSVVYIDGILIYSEVVEDQVLIAI